MKSNISHLNFYEDSDKEEKNKINFLKIIQSCFCLILIDRFLISLNANCAESFNFLSIEDDSRRNPFKDQIEALNELVGILSLKIQEFKDTKGADDRPMSKLDDKQVLLTPETENLTPNICSLEVKIFKLQCNLYSMQSTTIPDIIKDFHNNKSIQDRIIYLINEIKEKIKYFDKNLIEKIENEFKNKQFSILASEEVIKNANRIVEKLISEFKTIKDLVLKRITSCSSNFLNLSFESYDSQLNEIEKKLEKLFQNLILEKVFLFKKKVGLMRFI